VTGLSGTNGTQGLTGAQGLTGVAGVTGLSGTNGTQGLTGAQGHTGLQGATGLVGTTGSQGNTGAQGLTGVAGVTGLVGITGTAGLTGAQGLTGVAGVTGLSGTNGTQGLTGAQGLTGVAGVTGLSGTNGTQGLTGAQGLTGVAGVTGFQGTTGSQGNTGAQGLTGIAGVTGFQGLTGLRGVTGFIGLTGSQGHTGAQGLTGANPLIMIGDVTNEPTGFPNRVDSVLGFTGGTRNVSIKPASSTFAYYQKGVSYTKSAIEFASITDTEGLWFVYYDGTTLTTTQVYDDSLITNKVMVAIVYWDATNKKEILFGEERHGLTMDGITHLYLHRTRGCQWDSGLGLNSFVIGNGSLATHVQFGYDLGKIRDEDIDLDISAAPAPANIPIYWRNDTNWRIRASVDNFPFIYSGLPEYTGAQGRLPYNLIGAGPAYSGSLVQVTSNDYVLMHYFATNDLSRPIVGFQGQLAYTTAASAEAGAASELESLFSIGLPFAEFVALATVIYQTGAYGAASQNARIVQVGTANYYDWRGIGINGSASSGNVGPRGATGLEGSTGLQGITGLIGLTGAQGLTGTAGVTGLVGITGTIGLTGSQGLTGVAGVTGLQGATGSQGNTGAQGLTGVAGVTGLSGTNGTQGLTGAQGLTGVAGVTGLSGTNGTQGLTGAQGLTGVAGVTGLSGTNGTQGLTGAQGLTGVAGVTGLSGTNGTQGLTGAQGLTGVAGVTGLSGTTGLVGLTGAQGLTGVAGLGVTGVQGLTGPVGSGVTGIQGTTGLANFIDRSDWPSIGVAPILLWNQLDEALYVGVTGVSHWVQVSAGSQQGTTGSEGKGSATGIFNLMLRADSLATGIQGDFRLPYTMQLDGWSLMTRDVGNISIGLWKSSFANYPPTATGAMHIGATGPYLYTGTTSESDNLSGWATTTGAYGDVITVNILSVTGINSIGLALKYHQY
jgi:collagen type VII alpha